jgi:NADH dehydrogenase
MVPGRGENGGHTLADEAQRGGGDQARADEEVDGGLVAAVPPSRNRSSSAPSASDRVIVVRGSDGGTRTLPWSRLILAVGVVGRGPGLGEPAFGVRTLAEATRLRDHVIRSLDRADAADDPQERRALATFVVVGAGYADSETTAQLARFARCSLDRFPRVSPSDLRWVLVDAAEQVLPELGARLGRRALAALRHQGVEVRLGKSVEEVSAGQIRLSDGAQIPTHTVVWCTGVVPDPLIGELGLPTRGGRLAVDATRQVAGAPRVFALGDAAAVPDLARAGRLAPQTAQHAQRQGRAAAQRFHAAASY